MASINPRGDGWFAQVRRAGHKSISKTFPRKSQAVEWARSIEAKMDAHDFRDSHSLKSLTFGDLVARYREELEPVKKFSINKDWVLTHAVEKLGNVTMARFSADRIGQYLDQRRAAGAGGVTLALDLTYISGVLRTAAHIWKLPVDLQVVRAARARLAHIGVSFRGNERKRRPSADELTRLRNHFNARRRKHLVPMADVMDFAVATAMRLGEIARIRWTDIDTANRTVIIRDRKHPRVKLGNDWEVPLLGEAWEIVQRQPRVADEPRIFPVRERSVSCIFPRACNELGIVDLHFHDLRHEGVSRLFEAGYTVEQVSLVSGHRDWKMLARYTQIKAKDLHRPSDTAPISG